MPDQLEPLARLLGNHPWIQALAVLLAFFTLVKIVQWLVLPMLQRLTSRTETDFDDILVSHLRRPLSWTIGLVGVLIASVVAGIGSDYRGVLISAVLSMLILVWTLFAMRIARQALITSSRRAQANSIVRPQTLPLFTNLAAIAFIVFGVYFMFNAWHVDMTAWLASAGIAGIAIGFAAKDTLANLFSGVFIMADSPYKIGDYIVLDDGGGLRGKVTHIGIRSTRVLTRDDVEVTIPNSIIGNSKVVNESGGPYEKFRIRVNVGVAYGSDVDKVRAALMSVAEASRDICDTPEPRVRFRAFGASSLDFVLLCWVDNPELRGRVLDTLNTAVYKRFIEEGIEIPYSKHDVYIKEMPRQAD
ncbi:MAG: mechanosensitive ion channel family protein [Gammaproteobacteria bacterium]|nr:mechanosensitive ion channel family protein [Gammaproteobacteria bacterium]MCP5299842.1 mechanosensitive ion channel family protein [Chromatiaceae bacterium]